MSSSWRRAEYVRVQWCLLTLTILFVTEYDTEILIKIANNL
jgi:hypothetical protein